MKTVKRQWHRVISILLVTVMLFSALPAAAFAAPGDGGEAEVVEKRSETAELMASAFAPPVKSLAATGYQLKDGGAGSLVPTAVTSAEWLSASHSGVYFYYQLEDSGSGKYTNNSFVGAPLPSGFGGVYYCYVYYVGDPSSYGRGLTNLVPVGMSQSA